MYLQATAEELQIDSARRAHLERLFNDSFTAAIQVHSEYAYWNPVLDGHDVSDAERMQKARQRLREIQDGLHQQIRPFLSDGEFRLYCDLEKDWMWFDVDDGWLTEQED